MRIMLCKCRTLSVVLLLALLLGLMPGAGAEQLLLPESLAAETAILIDAKTGAPLFEKNADRAMYPASTTKIMTCLLALEYGHLEEEIVIPKEAANVPKDSSLMPVTVGEEMMFIDLLYGLMLHSGNDSANAVAVIVGGSIDGFVDMMNAKAAELGMTNTHFSNAHGYHADDHYTTARDMARLVQAAMQNPEFRQIVGTPAYIIEPTNKRSERLKMVNSNLMLISETEYY
ncbi:MAG: D-alanyl-D-alanine carboxypeptidase, partial [Clostridia bacterium]|nr:D-alanyl-D-alanine carboxypeptidase [Clostridia bacterium]